MPIFCAGDASGPNVVRPPMNTPVMKTSTAHSDIAFVLNTAAYTTEIFRGFIADTPFGEVQAVMSDVNGNAVIDFGGGDTITLKNIASADLHQDDFMFVFSPPGKRSGLGMDLCSQFLIIPKQHGDA